MLKTTKSSKKLALKAFKSSNNKVVEGNKKTNKIIIDLSKSNKLKNNNCKNFICMLYIRITEKSIFFTSNIKKIFNRLI